MAPQPTPDGAASIFISAWEHGTRATALSVATSSAVAALFAHGYDGETLNDRDCTQPGVNAVICTWGPYGGASPTLPIYELTMGVVGNRWYVASVTEE